MQKDGPQVCGAVFENAQGETLTVNAAVTIDAGEYGDLLALAGCEYDLGRESRTESGEAAAPAQSDRIIQDLTYVAILKDYGPGSDHTISRPPDYDPNLYRNSCREVSGDPAVARVDCETMLNYGRLPNGKYMLNWPHHGNDYYLDLNEMPREARLEALQAAKDHTLGFVYFIQTELGRRQLGLARHEFPTPDRLPLIPYIRESRRLRGLVRLTAADLQAPYGNPARELFRQAVAVGNYPLDHHHYKYPRKVEEDYPPIPAFSVPYGCLVPREVDGLLVGEKSISVTHIVNGCTRLQPVIMQVGQAAGASAALCVQQHKQPREVAVREIQEVLLAAGCWLLPLTDVEASDWAFAALQRCGIRGAMRGEGVSKDWANEMRIYPEDILTRKAAGEVLARIFPAVSLNSASCDLADGYHQITRQEALQSLWELIGRPQPFTREAYYDDLPAGHPAFAAVQYACEKGWCAHWAPPRLLQPDKPLTRRELAFILDAAGGVVRH